MNLASMILNNLYFIEKRKSLSKTTSCFQKKKKKKKKKKKNIVAKERKVNLKKKTNKLPPILVNHLFIHRNLNPILQSLKYILNMNYQICFGGIF